MVFRRNVSLDTWILGINSAYHESSACLIKNGEIIAAAEEERFNRIRHGKRADLLNPHWLPEESIRFCLDYAGIKPGDLDYIGYSFVPEKRLAFNIGVDKETMPDCAGSREGEERFYELLKTVPDRLSELLGEDISYKFQWLEHHLCHASSAYFVSPFKEAAILSVDGIGEATSTWLGVGKGNKIEAIKEITYPNSLGFVWTKLSRFLGFGEKGQWKVMGLAAFGNPDRYYGKFRKFVNYDSDGNFTVDNDYLQYRLDSYAGLEQLFGKHRVQEEYIEQRHQDIAAALQKLTNEAMRSFCDFLYKKTNLPNLCQAGGVALNCITNRFILEHGPFESVFVQPAANDAGTALGACYYIWNNLLGKPKETAMSHVYLGPEFSDSKVVSELEERDISAQKIDNIEQKVAALIAGGEIVAWFQGRMEFGPRALGNRSILADPRRPDMVHYINEKIKHREYFRPFAASVLAEKAEQWFEFSKHSVSDCFMLYARKKHKDKLGKIPAVTHIDRSCRIQCVDREANAKFYRLIVEFEKITGVPLVLNTSFNDTEPIICSPEDAIKTCINADIRFLAIGDYLIDFEKVNLPYSDVQFTNNSDFVSSKQSGTSCSATATALATLKQSVALAFRSR